MYQTWALGQKEILAPNWFNSIPDCYVQSISKALYKKKKKKREKSIWAFIDCTLWSTVMYQWSLEYTNWIPWKTFHKNGYGFDTKLHPVVRLQFWSSEHYRINSWLPLLPDSLWPGVVVPVRVLFMGQINMSEIMMSLSF